MEELKDQAPGLRAWLKREEPTVATTALQFVLYMVGNGFLITCVPILLVSALALFGQIGSGWSAHALGTFGIAAGLACLWFGAAMTRRHGPW